jgi:hypothetical protein
MNSRPLFVFLAAATWIAGVLVELHAAALEPVHGTCSIRAGERPGTFRIRIKTDCQDQDSDCHSDFSENSSERFGGLTLLDLSEEGARRTATLEAEPGSFSCTGIVRGGELEGTALFTPNDAFVGRMAQMGFSGLDGKKLEVFAFFDIRTAWAKSLQETGIAGITTDKLIPLRIFHVDKEYIGSITALGYDLPSADKLIELKVQGVDPDEVREIRAMGYNPNLDELVQLRIFHITPDFVRRMQARGLKNLTIAKLVQIRIFDLAD